MPTPSARRLEGQIAIVTGGKQGFGLAIVELFVAHGARVASLDLSYEQDGPLSIKGADDGVAIQIKANVTSRKDWERAVEQCQKAFGDVPSICINNAGWTYSNKSSLEVTEDEFDRVFEINVKSLYWSSLVLVPELQKRGQGGSFVTIASTAGVRPRPKLVWYNATKAAAINANKSLALEFAKDNIRFNCECSSKAGLPHRADGREPLWTRPRTTGIHFLTHLFLCVAIGAGINPVAGTTPLLSKFAGARESGDALTDAQLKQFMDSVPLGRLSTGSDIANAALFFADPSSSFLTGTDLNIDGGRCV